MLMRPTIIRILERSVRQIAKFRLIACTPTSRMPMCRISNRVHCDWHFERHVHRESKEQRRKCRQTSS